LKIWQIWVDTGGTFTDCIATTPTGDTKRIKVLSSSFLRAKLVAKIAPHTFHFEANWPFDAALLVGFSVRMMGQEAFAQIINIQANALTVSVDWDLTAPCDFEITSHEEAPVLATRLVTQTPLGQLFPPLKMRLGTTKGTNALLEGKGAKVALFITKGFKDLLRIGTQQRPHLFQLNIAEPTLLYDAVFEVDERLDKSGEILTALQETELQKVDEALKNAGCQSVAVSFLHSYQNPVHEKQMANLPALSSFFGSFSAQLSPSINYLKRTQTALVNAYLQPILAAYLQNITQSLGPSVQVMTSAGGLVNATAFLAKDSLLSGPAGGMVGAANIAQQLGFERCLSFDMGGTSTDTARFDGQLDLQFSTKIEGIELHTPTLAIETVTAGGGSICAFDGQKLTVGPQSAGASPGPACYGAGGPLTITDINLLLGKLDSTQFGIPVRIDKAREALAHIQRQVLESTRQNITDKEALMGFEQIANEKMAEAIRRISVAKGFDPKAYPLLTFGGAGGLHGCQLADMLGISTVILPYDAGLLSAFGMGQARAERIVSRQILASLDAFESTFSATVSAMQKQAFAALIADGCLENAAPDLPQPETINANFDTQILLYLRFKGQESPLEIRWEQLENWGQLRGNFVEKYRQIFGYCPQNLPIEIESIKFIASEPKVAQPKVEKPTKKRVAQAHYFTSPFFEEAQRAVFDWEQLQAGDTFCGPAVLSNATSTAFIAANWEAICTTSKDVVVEKKAQVLEKSTVSEVNQSIELALFTNRFMAIAEEMGAQLQRTAFSVNVKERLDFSCALLDANAELLVNAPHIPVHLGSLGVCARLVRDKLPLAPGDVVMTNHPKYGGSHLPDVTLLAGVFATDNQLIGYVINRAHHAEIGGRTPGSMPPDATTLEEEGVVILPTYLAKSGQMQWQVIEDLFTKCRYPTRAFSDNLADINAALASLKTGELALQKLTVQHGFLKVQHYMNALKDSAFAALKQALVPYQNQTFAAAEYLDDGHKIAVSIVTDAREGSCVFDFTGTSLCHPHNLNANISIIYSTILYVLRLLVNQNIPLNEGLTRAVKVILPENSFLHPNFADQAAQCPAVVGGNTEVSQRLTDVLLKAFGLAACSQGTMNNFLFGNVNFGYYETICGGTGAGAGFDGRAAVHQHMTNTRITDPEELERRYPVRLQQFSVRENSGGNGKWRGGNGVIREIAFLDSLRVTLITQHRTVPPYGLAGGESGQVGQQTLFKADGSVEKLAGICTLQAQMGDRLRIETPGGGGYGSKDVN